MGRMLGFGSIVVTTGGVTNKLTYHQSYKVQKRNQCADSINEKHLKNTKGADIKAFIHKTVMELLC